MNDGHEFGEIDWLGDVELKACAQGAGAIIGAGKSCESHRGHPPPTGQLADTPDELVTVLSWHADIAQHYLGSEARELIERFLD